MKGILFYFTLLILFNSCELKVKEISKPKDLIAKDTMVVILEEIMIVENYIQERYPNIYQFKESVKKSGDRILNKHHVSFKRFNESIDYYGSHQDMMKEIYNKVLEKMNGKLNRLQAE